MEKWELQSAELAKDQAELIEILLKNRGLKGKAQEKFLNPPHPKNWSLEDLEINRSDFKKIKARLKQAREKQEQLIIYGDYDADGVCASTILWEGLRTLGIESTPFIPNRARHGYGLSIQALEEIFEQHGQPDLLITVDNGIVALPALEFLAEKGVEVIVTDHHQPDQSKLPALAVFHSTQICGAAVAWFLIKELFAGKHQQKLEDLLSVAAIATVTDLMPLLGINRSLLSHGLTALRKTERPGLKALCHLAKVKPADLNAYHLGYVIGPRINAMGRLADSMQALRLLCTQDLQRAQKLANLLQQTNNNRRDLTKELAAQADDGLAEMLEQEEIIIVSGDYHEGVIGLLAGNLTEKYLKPSIVLSVSNDADGEAVIKASARSLSGFNLTDFLRQAEDLLIDVGGHPLAAGFSLYLKNLDALKKQLFTLARQQLQDIKLKPVLKLDCELAKDLLTLKTAQAISILEPHGKKNPRPTFLLKKLKLKNMRPFGSEANHLRLYFADESGVLDHELVVLAWRGVELFPDLTLAQDYDLAIKIEANFWHGKSRLQVVLKSIKKA